MFNPFRKQSRVRDQVVEQIPRLRRYARALTGNTVAAEDLLQESLAHALERLGQWQPDTDLRAWLFTVMHNLHISEHRRSGRQPELYPLESLAEPLLSVADAEQDQRLAELERALQQLTLEQREVLLLVTLEGMPYRTVAQVLNIAEGTVMSRLHRAREQLRSGLAREPKPGRMLRRVK